MSSSTSPNPLQHLSDALSQAVAGAAPSVVGVTGARSRSSGLVWRAGLVVTADEALPDDGDVSVVLPGGRTSPARIVGRDPTTDIALLRIDAADVAPIALQRALPPTGAITVAVGARNGAPTAAFGCVTFAGAAWRSLRGGEIDARIELDLTLGRSAEGAVVLDAGGQAFGMAVFGPRRRVIVIPAATIERVAGKLESHGRVPRGYLGLGLQPVRLGEARETGLMVMSVDPKGPGAAAGLQQGDVIATWNDAPVADLRTLMRSLGPDSVGSTARLIARRAGESKEFVLTIGERPEA